MRIYIVSLLLLIQQFAFSQFGGGDFENPAIWSVKAEQVGENQVLVVLNADVEQGWYLYSQKNEEGGPIPLSFTYNQSDAYTTNGETLEQAQKIKSGHDAIFDMELTKLYGDSEFTQLIDVKDASKKLTGEFVYQICKDVCLPPTAVPFAVDLTTLKTALGEKDVDAFLGTTTVVKGDKIVWPEYGNPKNDCTNNATAVDAKNSSNWGVFFLGVLGGLVALLTPCVFPMIPLTVTFFTKRHEKKARGVFEAILYGLSIFLVYFLLAVPFLVFKLPKDTLYTISTSPVLNIAFFLIFMFFALSLFGFYELTLPNKWANKTDQASNKGGLVGIFFMAITLAIVSFSCTGPILGSLMASSIASEGGQLKLVFGMSGFGVALGLPFAIFAMFPGIMKKLPKSGAWMNTVKVVLAFVEVAFALKFLSMADLVNQWKVLTYEVFIIIWALVVLGLALYLFGIIRFPHDNKNIKIGKPRMVLGTVVLLFAGYIVSGLFGNNLKALSGFPPPQYYSWNKNKKSDDHIPAVKDLAEGIAQSEKTGKPMLLDFTGWSCVNCRDVEQNIWTDPEVAQRLKEDFVLVSLYADDRNKLPENERYKSESLEKTVKTIGGKWTDFEATSFGKISQPLYAIVTPKGELMNAPIAHTKSVDDYKAFLDCGKQAYEAMK